MQKKSKRFWITVVIAAVIAVISVVGILFGVLFHKEETFLLTCLPETEGNDLFTSIHEDHCPVVSWEDNAFPLCVYVENTRNRPTGFLDSLEGAISAVNAEFKRKIFLPGWDESCLRGENPYVSVFSGMPYERHWFEKAGHVAFRRERRDGRLRAAIYVGNTPSDGVLHYVLMHELGHVLFLKHDEYRSSIMHPGVGDPFFFSTPGSVLEVQHFSDTDVAAIQEQYPNLSKL